MKYGTILSLFVANALYGQVDTVNNLSSLSLEELLTVKFSEVSRKEQSNLTTPSAVYTLTSEQIQRSGATNIPEALRLIPGVHVGRISGSQYAISIRSPNTLLSDQMLVMVDGREVFNRLFNGTYWDSIDTMLEDIDRIEVIRGPGSSLWGSNAGNGIINIVTKKASDTQGTVISTTIGNGQDHGRVSARVGFKGEQSATRFYVTTKDVDRSEYKRNHEKANDALHFQQAGFRHDVEFNNGSQLDLHGDIYKGDSELAKTTPDNSSLHGGNIVALYQPDENTRIQAYYDYTSRKRENTSSTYKNCDLDIQQMKVIDQHSILYGGSVRYTLHNYDYTSTPSGTIAVDPAKRNDLTYRAFVQDEIKWDSFSLIPGIKYEYNEYVASQWQPSIKLAFYPSENQTLWGSYSRSVATPSRISSDGYLDFGSGTTVSIRSNPLNPDIQNIYEMGYKIHPNESLYIDAATFYNNYQTISPNSIDKTYGGEINIVYHPLETLRTEASYTYTNGHTNVKKDLLNLYEHIVSAHINYDLSSNLQTDAYYYYYSKTSSTEPIHRIDFRVSYQWNPSVLVELIGQNLFNSEYVEANQDPNITLNTFIDTAYLVKATFQF